MRAVASVLGLWRGDVAVGDIHVTDEVWAATDADGSALCVECLEARIDRVLEPEDFPPLPLNDDDEHDSVRLRERKGSGRATEGLYVVGADAVVDLGADVEKTAKLLRVDPDCLAVWVSNRRLNVEVLTEWENE
jgi:hypothetical protein